MTEWIIIAAIIAALLVIGILTRAIRYSRVPVSKENLEPSPAKSKIISMTSDSSDPTNGDIYPLW
jgi:hypothetical protein